jgi:hypothetical protein
MAVYTTIISINKNKSILTYRHSITGQRYFVTYFDLHEVIIKRIYKISILVLGLFFNIDLYYYNLFSFFIVNTTFLLNIILLYDTQQDAYNKYCCSVPDVSMSVGITKADMLPEMYLKPN